MLNIFTLKLFYSHFLTLAITREKREHAQRRRSKTPLYSTLVSNKAVKRLDIIIISRYNIVYNIYIMGGCISSGEPIDFDGPGNYMYHNIMKLYYFCYFILKIIVLLWLFIYWEIDL